MHSCLTDYLLAITLCNEHSIGCLSRIFLFSKTNVITIHLIFFKYVLCLPSDLNTPSDFPVKSPSSCVCEGYTSTDVCWVVIKRNEGDASAG